MGGVLSLGSLREASCLGFFSLFGHRGKGATPGAPGGWERAWDGQGRGASVLKSTGVWWGKSFWHPGFLAVVPGESLGAVPSTERDSAGICSFGTVLGPEWRCVGT